MTGTATRFSTAVATASLLALGCAHADNDARAGLFPRDRDREHPPPTAPAPHPCPTLPPASPLAALESKAVQNGCPADVQLRPGTYPEADVLFTCPASPDPMIILRGHGQTRFRAPADPRERQRLRIKIGEAARGLVREIANYGPDGVPAPLCTTSARGLVMSIFDYDDVDIAVEGLRRWIHANDLEIELVILLAPEPPRPQELQLR